MELRESLIRALRRFGMAKLLESETSRGRNLR